MKKQVFNPYLPSWEYIPDGEPHVYDGRVYVYGSHDRFNDHVYCLNDTENMYSGGAEKNGFWLDSRHPRITQDGRDGDEQPGYIMNMTDSATCGFKYFDCRGIRRVSIKVRGYCRGAFQVKTAWDGDIVGEIPVGFTNGWTEYIGDIAIPDGIQSIYFTYRGMGSGALLSFPFDKYERGVEDE